MLRNLAFAASLAVIGTASTAAIAQEFRFEAVPQFENCGDSSLQRAQHDGLTLGISPSPPYSSFDPLTNKAAGIDVEINQAALNWLGITKVHYDVMPFGQLIPALMAHRIDVLAADIHITPDRLKAVAFTGPAWWYGPAIVVQKSDTNPPHGFDELKGRKIGVVAGSAADEYLRSIGVADTPFPTDDEEFAAITTGRVEAIVEDDVKVMAYISANKSAPIEIVPNVKLPDDLIYKYGYGYARYAMRKEDCSLRAAYTQALVETRGNGEVSSILKKYGLSNRNLFFFPLGS
jgi:polar amino acid transport system substrate-binding protein